MSDKEVHVGEADGAMGEPLEAECEAIRTLESQCNRQEIAMRYKMAEHCRNIVEGDGEDKRHGTHAVEQAANAIPWSETQIYVYAQIAQIWTKEQVMELQAGKGCTWAHLVILARDKLAEDRESLIEKISTDGLSARELARQVAGKGIPGPQGPAADYFADVSPSVPVVTGIQDYSANVAHFESESRAFVDRLRASIAAAAAADLTSAALQQLRQLKQRRKAAYEYDIKTLDDCIAKAQKGKPIQARGGDGQAGGHQPGEEKQDPGQGRRHGGEEGSARRHDEKVRAHGQCYRIGKERNNAISKSFPPLNQEAINRKLFGPWPQASGPATNITPSTARRGPARPTRWPA